MVDGIWYIVCGMRYVVCGMWYAVYGMRYVVCGICYIPYCIWDFLLLDHALGKGRNAKRANFGCNCCFPPAGGKKLQPKFSLLPKLTPIHNLSVRIKVHHSTKHTWTRLTGSGSPRSPLPIYILYNICCMIYSRYFILYVVLYTINCKL